MPITNPVITVGGVDQVVSEIGSLDPGYEWYFVEGEVGVSQNPASTPVANGVPIDIKYPAPFPLAFYAEDAASIASRGLYEAVHHARDVQTQEGAEDLAQGLLDLYGDADAIPESISFEYNSKNQESWLSPGMAISVNRTFPTASGTYLVERVSSELQDLTIWRHNVTLRAGPGEVTDAAAIEEFRSASRVPATNPATRITLELDIDGTGIEVGDVVNRYEFQEDGVFTYWSALPGAVPPSGADVIVDAFLNGTSILTASKIRFLDGQTTANTGFQFASDNLGFSKGDVLTWEVLQVGSSEPGKYGAVYLGIKQRYASR